MKRSNRLVLLIGVFLAVVAFAGIFVTLQGGSTQTGASPAAPTELPTVFAKTRIPLGTEVTVEMLEVRQQAVVGRDASSFAADSLVIGKIARQDIAAGAQLVTAHFATGRGEGLTQLTVPAGFGAMAVQVDQVTGVGTLINTGDFVDVVVGITGDRFPLITIDPATDVITPVAGINATSVKVLVQGAQVVGTLLPPVATPPPAAAGDTTGTGTEPETTLTGQQQLVFLAVTTQQEEVIKFAQIDGNVSLVLRSAKDFPRDLTTQEVIFPPVAPTTGITLHELVNGPWGVLPPELVETVLPATQQQQP